MTDQEIQQAIEELLYSIARNQMPEHWTAEMAMEARIWRQLARDLVAKLEAQRKP